MVDRGPCSTVLPQPPGLEPEIQKLIARHKQEVKKLKGLHATELLQAEERAAQHYGRQAEELREHLEREKEALGRQEWERAQQRWGSRGHGWCAQTPRVNSTSFLAASFQDQRNLGGWGVSAGHQGAVQFRGCALGGGWDGRRGGPLVGSEPVLAALALGPCGVRSSCVSPTPHPCQ